MRHLFGMIAIASTLSLIGFSIYYKDWIVNNTDYLAIIISVIASLSSLSSVIFSILLFNIKDSQKEVRITMDTQTPIFNIAGEEWMALKIHNYGDVTAKNPKLTLFIENSSQLNLIYNKGYTYTMYPTHYFNFHFATTDMPPIKPKDRLLAKIEYTNTKTNKNEVESIPFMISQLRTVDANTGESQNLNLLVPTCAEFDSYSDPLMS